MKKKLLLYAWAGFALLAFSGLQNTQAQNVDSFFDVFTELNVRDDPYLEVSTMEDWKEALYGGFIKAGTNEQWKDYMGQWELYGPPDEIYPANEFSTPQLYLHEDPTGLEDTAGLVMMWGETDLSAGTSTSSNWFWDYTADPDLSNATIQITVTAPPFINVVSFGMRDVNGNIRAWYWSVGMLATDPIQPNTPTVITINTALLGVGAATPQATAYMNNPAFDPTQVLAFIFDENAVWVSTAPVPPPGQVDPRPWNYWQNLIVKPNPPLPSPGLQVGFNVKIHQGIFPQNLWPNDFHIRGRIQSGDPYGNWNLPPLLIKHIDGVFPASGFTIVIEPDYTHPSGLQNWYKFEANWVNPITIPFCTRMHIGLKFRAWCHNVIIDAFGWWTLNGQRIDDPYGYVRLIGFEVLDNVPTDPDPVADDPANPADELQRVRIQIGNNDGNTEDGEIETEIVEMSLMTVSMDLLSDKYPDMDLFEELNEDSEVEKTLPFIPVKHPDGRLISEDDPVVLDSDPATTAESFFDVFTEMEIGGGEFAPETPFRIEPDDILITRQRFKYLYADGTVDYHWNWHWHQAHRGLRDLGDAPDSTNHFGARMTAYNWGRIAQFPTVYRVGPPLSAHGPIHWFPRRGAFLGKRVTLETEADIGFDQDPTNNIIPRLNRPNLDKADDGVRNMPLRLPHCIMTRFSYIVTVVRPGTYYTNVWFDYNRDGDWNDTMYCPAPVGAVAPAPEHAVQDYAYTFPNAGTYVINTPYFRAWDPWIMPWLTNIAINRPLPLWMRITLSERQWDGSYDPVSPIIAWAGGSGSRRGYIFGETEDYIFTPRKCCCIGCPDFNGDGIINLIDFAEFARYWLKSCEPNTIITPQPN